MQMFVRTTGLRFLFLAQLALAPPQGKIFLGVGGCVHG